MLKFESSTKALETLNHEANKLNIAMETVDTSTLAIVKTLDWFDNAIGKEDTTELTYQDKNGLTRKITSVKTIIEKLVNFSESSERLINGYWRSWSNLKKNGVDCHKHIEKMGLTRFRQIGGNKDFVLWLKGQKPDHPKKPFMNLSQFIDYASLSNSDRDDFRDTYQRLKGLFDGVDEIWKSSVKSVEILSVLNGFKDAKNPAIQEMRKQIMMKMLSKDATLPSDSDSNSDSDTDSPEVEAEVKQAA